VIQGLLNKLKNKIVVDIQMNPDTFQFCTTTSIMGEEFSVVTVDANPMYEIFKARLVKELGLQNAS
jgi:hypothetical protein